MRRRLIIGIVFLAFGAGAGFVVAHIPHTLFTRSTPANYVELRASEGTGATNGPDASRFQRDKGVSVKRVIDGDTAELENGDRVRLIGVDAPELGTCYAKEAGDIFASLVLNTKLTLESGAKEKDQYGRTLGYLYVGSLFVNEELVRRGAAVAKPYPPDTIHEALFAAVQERAKRAKRGLWGLCGGIQTPVPQDAGTTPALPAPSLECNIKGDRNTLGEHFYYPRQCPAYDVVVIDVRAGERWFCSAEEAEASGWKKAKECP